MIVVMGVSGSGKTTVASKLAGRLGWPFEEGDSLHPHSNVEKMKAGHPLTDEDRAPWLDAIAAWIDARLDAQENGVITSSALKRRYRELLNRRGGGVVFVFLSGTKESIAERLELRRDHFMPAALLDSQFHDLETPASDEPALTFDVEAVADAIVQEIIDRLQLGPG